MVHIPRQAVPIASQLFTRTIDAAVQARGTPDELGANVAILLFPRAILAPLPPGMHGYSAAGEYRRRRDAWLAGDLESLLHRPTAPRAPTTPSTDRKYYRAAAFASAGLFRKARQALQSFGSPPADHLTVRKLMQLHPPRKFPAVIDPPAAPALPLGHSDLERIFINMPRRSSTHRDGWRWEHLRALCEDNVATARSLIAWLQLLLAGSLPAQILDYLRSSTLVAFNKLSREEQQMLASCERKIRPIAIGSVLIRAALTLVIMFVRSPLAKHLLGVHQFVFGFAAPCEAVTHALHASMQLHPDWSMLAADIFNAFNEVSRTAIWQELTAAPGLEPLLPVTHWLYMTEPSELWYYDQELPSGPPVAIILSQEGTRQGCVLGAILFALALVPVCRSLAEIAPLDSTFFAYADDMRIVGSPQALAAMAAALPPLLQPLGLRIEPPKCAVLLPPDANAADYPPELHQFPFKPGMHSLGMPFAAGAAPDGHLPLGLLPFVEEELQKIGAAHDELLDDIYCLAESFDKPHEALRMLQVVGVRRFQYLLRALPPAATSAFAADRDCAVLYTFKCIIGLELVDLPRYTVESLHLPARFGGAALPSMHNETPGAHLASWAATLAPMLEVLRSWRTPAATAIAAEMGALETSPLPYAQHARMAAAAVHPLTQLPAQTLEFAGRIARAQTPVLRAGVQVPRDVPPPQAPLTLPTFADIKAAPSPGLHTRITQAAAARSAHSAFQLIPEVDAAERARFLSRCGHGGAAFLVADKQPQLHPVPASIYRLATARVLGLPHPAVELSSCDRCGLHFASKQLAADHFARCPKSGAYMRVHKNLLAVVNTIVDEAGFARDRKNEVTNLRPDGTRPADILIANYGGTFRDVIVDVTAPGVIGPARHAHARHVENFIATPGAAARRAECTKFRQDENSSRPLRSVHRFVPFAVEEFGRLGDHAEAFLFEMAKAATASRSHLLHLPDDSPQMRFFLQQKLKDWRQRISLAINCTHALVIQQRACSATSRGGRRQPPPHNLFADAAEEPQDVNPAEDFLEAADYSQE